MSRDTVLITGASGGIGREFAVVFAQHGFDLALAARNIGKPEALAAELSAAYGCKTTCFEIDLSSEHAAQRLYLDTKAAGIAVDQLVNNAGAGKSGRTIDTELEDMEALIRLNVMSVTGLCRLFGADMAAAGRGKILNVSSLSAYLPDPFFNVYGPTKAFELYLTQTMYGELRGSGVTVSVICPGAVKTNWASNAGKSDSRKARDPMEIARIGYEGMQQGKLVIIPTMQFKWDRLWMSLLPVSTRARIMKKWQEKLIIDKK